MAEDIRMKAKFPMLKHLRVAGLVNFPIQLGRSGGLYSGHAPPPMLGKRLIDLLKQVGIPE